MSKNKELSQVFHWINALSLLLLTLTACSRDIPANMSNTSAPTLSATRLFATTPMAVVPEPTLALAALFESVSLTLDAVDVHDQIANLNVGSILAPLDVSDRQAPRLLGAVMLPVETIFNLYMADGYAYVAAAEQGLRIVDISNLSQPVEVGAYYPSLLGEIADYPWSEGQPPWPLFFSQGVRAVAVDQAAGQVYACVAALGAGLRVINVTNPTQSVEVGVLATSEEGFVDVALANGLLYLAKPNVGVQIVDVSEPTTPRVASLVPLAWPNEVWSLNLPSDQADSTYVYGAAGTCVSSERSCFGLLQVINVANSVSPKAFSSSQFDGYSTDLAVRDRQAYLLARAGLYVLDVSDPTQPGYTTQLPLAWAKDITVAGDTLYVAIEKCTGQCRPGASRDGILQMCDLADPARPALVSGWQPPG